MNNGKSKNGNGNGTPKPPIDVSALKTNDKGQLVIDDLVPASVLIMFFVQKLGKASISQIATKVEAANVVMDEHLMQNAIEALQSRQFLSYAKGKKSGTGEIIDQWKARKANFSGVPETAQVSQSFLSELVATQDARDLIGSLNAAEEEGDGTAKAKEKLKYADYQATEVTFKVKDLLLGGRPGNPLLDQRIQRGPKYPQEAKLRFPRNHEGNPVIPMSNIRGWLASGLRTINISEAVVGYIGIEGGRIDFKGPITQWAQPVVDLGGAQRGAGGLGITTYEAIETSEDNPVTIKFTFTMPKRGFLTHTQFVAFLIKYAASSPRGLSNARSNEHGFVEVVDAKFLGDVDTAKKAIEPVLDGMSPEGRLFAEKFLANLGDRDVGLFTGRHVEVE